MKIEFETDEMTVAEMGAVRRLLRMLMHEAESYDRITYDASPIDTTLNFPKKGDKK